MSDTETRMLNLGLFIGMLVGSAIWVFALSLIGFWK
jgi:hypothetical protein